ncbi:MAG: thioesterase family protein [Myxococcales bacterium]|nr:thioesterase family protein [Myxococcales bacterium]
MIASELTRGPWHENFQHGGPVAALLGHAVERLLDTECEFVARVRVEFLRPVPIARLEPHARLVRDGSQVRTVEAELMTAGKLVARAWALAIRRRALGITDAVVPGALPTPESCPALELPFFLHSVGYHTAMELKRARGEYGNGALAAWMRARHPLVEGEPPSPLQRVLLAADSGNGVSARLDTRRHSFANPDLSVALHRDAEGDWIGLDAETSVEPDGIGLADTQLFDTRGPIGRVTQTLLVAEVESLH